MMPYKLPLLIAAGLLAVQAQAIRFAATNEYTVGATETLSEEQWIYAGGAEVNGTFKDDLFLLAGNQMNLAGAFERNVWGMGSEINLTGAAQQNIRLMGKTIQVDGQVGGNLMAIGDTVKISPAARIDGSIRFLGNSVILEGETQGDVSITASRIITVAGTINGNLNLVAPEIILQRDARIGGDLTYTANKELVPAEGIVAGQLRRAIPPAPPAFSLDQIYARALWFFAALLVGIPFITLFPMTVAIASQLVRTSPLKCLLVGALFALALPAAGIMSLSSIIGLPLGALILGSWGFMVYTSRIIIGLVIGSLILRSKSTSIGGVLLAMALGLAVIYTATAIPAISLSVHLVVISMGMGALLLGLFQKRRMLIQVPNELEQLKKMRDETFNPEEK